MHLFRTLLFLPASLLVFATPLAAAEEPWTIVSLPEAKIAVPKEWRNLDKIKPNMPVYRQGDGLGVPAMDETGAPLQIGMSLEVFTTAKETHEEIATALAKGATKDPRLKAEGEAKIEKVTLAGKTAATLSTSVFIKEESRRSLQMKLVSKAPDGKVLIASGFMVGGKDSKWPAPEGEIAQWLRAHLLSLAPGDAAMEVTALQAVYAKRKQK